MQPASEAPEIIGLLAQTRAALAHLRADELEALAAKAEAILAQFEIAGGNSHISARYGAPGGTSHPAGRDGAPSFSCEGALLQREYRLLGDLLAATGENLRVLRRARSSREGNSRWAL